MTSEIFLKEHVLLEIEQLEKTDCPSIITYILLSRNNLIQLSSY